MADGARSGGTVHVVGAGLSGLSAALALSATGRRVVIHEAQANAGGRCRSFHDPRLDREIDNGNHLVLSGNPSVAAHLSRCGAADRLIAEPEARFDFVDLADGRRWDVTLDPGRLQLWILDSRARIPGTRLGEYLDAARLAFALPEQTVAGALRGRGALWTRFWEPLTLAVLNTTPERGSAVLLWRAMRETFARGGEHCRPMLAPRGLGHALVEPAVERLAAEGVGLRTGRVLRAIDADGGRATVLRFSDGDEPLGRADSVILALPPARLGPLMPDLHLPEDSCAILNAFFVVDPRDHFALSRQPRILGVLSSSIHWIFRRGDVVSLTVSAADALGIDREPADTLLTRFWQEARAALGLPPSSRYVAGRINKERRATFDQSPAGVSRRPGPETRLANVLLAGDATDTGLPATIEGALRSGQTAAQIAAGVEA